MQNYDRRMALIDEISHNIHNHNLCFDGVQLNVLPLQLKKCVNFCNVSYFF